jgi:hypothetical protein
MADESEPLLSAPDDYEQRYMNAGGALLRVRQRQPRWVPATALAVMLGAMVLSWPSLAFMWSRRDVPGMALVLGVMVAWFAVNNVALLFALITDHITRVALTPSHLLVHRGLWTDEIPLAEVTSVEVEAAQWWRPKHTLKGALLRRERSYLTPGVERALRVEWRDAKGRARKTWVQFHEAHAFASRIASLRGGATGVRVEAAEEEAPSADEGMEDEVRPAGRRAARGGA